MGVQATVATTELLEREREFGTMSAALARAIAGTGSVLLIEAPAGAGKSALLGHARDQARRRGMRALEARGAVLERDFAFGVVRQLFEHELGALDPASRQAAFSGAAALAAQLLGEGPHDPAHDHGPVRTAYG
jgi:predicted ATPase